MTNRTRSDSPTKTCTIAGCDRALRARGLCATHYNQTHHAGRHDPKPTTCEVCGKPIERRAASATVDHIVPLSQGGNHTLANAQTLCLSCNSTKQDRAA